MQCLALPHCRLGLPSVARPDQLQEQADTYALARAQAFPRAPLASLCPVAPLATQLLRGLKQCEASVKQVRGWEVAQSPGAVHPSLIPMKSFVYMTGLSTTP